MRDNFTKEEIEFIQDNYKGASNKFTQVKSGFVKELTDKILDVTSHISTDKFKIRLWHIINDVHQQPICENVECDNHVTYQKTKFNYNNPYNRFCSNTCYSNSYNTNTFIEKAKRVHGDQFNYDQVQYQSASKKVRIRCPKHNITFEQTPNNHLNSSGLCCPECKREHFSNRYKRSSDEWIDMFKSVHGNQYDYSRIKNIDGARTPLEIVCKDHGNFTKDAFGHFTEGQGCPKCSIGKQKSKVETKVTEWLDSISISYETSNRDILGGREIDILIGNVGIEINGVYWHSDKFRDKNYHNTKKKDCEAKGITLLQFYCSDINNRFDIVKSMILNRIGSSYVIPIYARKCEVVSLDSVKEFLNENHLYGDCSTQYKYGLMFNGELVAVSTFSKTRMKGNYDYELVRYCNKLGHRVVGGSSKILKNFIRNVCCEGDIIVSYSDRRYSTGKMYSAIGFEYSHTSTPNYYYWKDPNKLESRQKYMKHKLKKFDSFSPDKTERQIMEEEGYLRIYDCGTDVWTMKK